MDGKHTRYHAIDHLRATMITIVMLGHAILPYTTIPRSFKDPQNHIGFDVVAIFLYGFAMPLFFMMAGFSTALLHDRKGARGLVRNRLRRIFLPLLVAYLVLTPLTRVAYKFAKNAASSGSLQAGIDAVQLADWLHWGKAYHLWFLVSLLLYSAFAIGLRWGVLRILGGSAERARAASRQILACPWRAVIVALVVAFMMVPAYVFYAGDATTVPMQLALFAFFLLGWLLYLHADLLPTLQKNPWRPIAVALFALPLAVWSTRERLFNQDLVQPVIGFVAGISNSVLAVCMTFGLLGLYQSHFNAYSRLGRYISDASYWIFLIHFPLLIAVAGVLAVTPWPAAIKCMLTVILVVPIVLVTYHWAMRTKPRTSVIDASDAASLGRRPRDGSGLR